MRLDTSCESSVCQTIHMKYQALFFLKNKNIIFRNVIYCSYDLRFEGYFTGLFICQQTTFRNIFLVTQTKGIDFFLIKVIT